MICCSSICRVWIALTGSSPAFLFSLWMESFPLVTAAMSLSSRYNTLLVCSMMALWVDGEDKYMCDELMIRRTCLIFANVTKSIASFLIDMVLNGKEEVGDFNKMTNKNLTVWSHIRFTAKPRDKWFLTWRQRQSNTPQHSHPPLSRLNSQDGYGCSSPGLPPLGDLQGQSVRGQGSEVALQL